MASEAKRLVTTSASVEPNAVLSGAIEPVPHEKPWVGAIVHFHDESRAAYGARVGAGPYAAMITALEPLGVALHVFGPQGGVFPVDRVRHKSEVGDAVGKKRWWEWPAR